MSKIITYDKEAREKLVKGVDAVASTVSKTLGPKGRNVVVGKQYGSPAIINDGVSIAKEIELKDPLENAGVRLLQEVSSKTNDAAGDGTTTASVLAQAIIHEGLKALENGANPIQMKDGIHDAVDNVVKFIERQAVEVDERRLEQVATVSAGNNPEIGKLIADAIKQVGDDGVVTVEESQTMGTSLKTAEGIQLEHGYLSPYFITDQERQECVLERPFILLVSKKINLITDITPIMEQAAKEGRSVLLVAEDVEGEALAFLVVNAMRKVLKCAAVKAPGFGDNRKNNLIDLGVITGATVWTEELGLELSKINLGFMGNATRVTLKKDETTIVVDDKTKEQIAEHVRILKAQLDQEDDDYRKEKLQERIARLAGGVAVIQVGAASEVELKERKLRVEDALNATKAAKAEGIVAGGGYTLLQAQIYENSKDMEAGHSDYNAGYNILVNALSLPIKQIAQNAGVDGDEVIKQCIEKKLGYNALTGVYEDLLEAGVVDPAKVTKSALINAASIAGMLLTTEAAIVEEPITAENGGFAPAGGAPMMM